MFKKLFKKAVYEITPPMNGRVMTLSEVPDQVFSGKMVGDGFAIEPSDGKVYSPVNGEIIQIFPTKHAIGIKDDQGMEILIHVGIDTVELKGQGFEAYVEKGDKLTKGQLLLSVDLDFVKTQGKSIVTPVVFTNQAQYQEIVVKEGTFTINDPVCEVRK